MSQTRWHQQEHQDCIKMLLCTAYVFWGLLTAIAGSVDNSIHSPEVDISPPKMVCGWPCDGVTKSSHAGVHPPMECFYQCAVVNVQLYIAGDPQCSACECYNNNSSVSAVCNFTMTVHFGTVFHALKHLCRYKMELIHMKLVVSV